ncbi:MAG TPA: hypothetical protein VEL07_04625 [Planctomycetota bacterium]|nr:hypothetical protein [Planctomycetota bacterium]
MPVPAVLRALAHGALIVLLCAIVATTALAAAEDEAPAKAENAVDPFDGKPIDPEIKPVSLTVAGRTWVIGFSSEANKRAAQADPRKAIELHRRRSGDAKDESQKPAQR